ncbi:MAG TPA: SDR family oxidoreductase [Candidatus Polarisedimenticolaceae bacterium]|nr:SDR family oxidoreductase [Candidatus Polarisedimenticolaceae bacterium]
MTRQVALVTGAARGIGLEAVSQLVDRGHLVFAAVRVAGSTGIADLARDHPGRVHEVVMDVADDQSVAGAAGRVAELTDRLDLLINNAGIYPQDGGGIETLDLGALLTAFQVNALGPLRVTRALLPLLRRGDGKRIVQVTSLMGSIGDNGSGGSYAYRMSKAALNMANRNLAHELRPEGFVCVAVHPGWVRTRMGGSAAPLGLREAVEQLLDNACGASPADSGGLRGPGRRALPF